MNDVEVKETACSGRGLFSTRVILKGEIIFSSPAAAAALHRKHLSLLCQSCFAYTEDVETPSAVVCSCCESTYYCSQKCLENDADLHSPHCALLPHVLSTKELKREESCHVRLLLRLLSRCCADPNVLSSVNMMMADHKGIPGFKRRVSQRKKAAAYFVGMLAIENAGETKESIFGLLAEQLQKFPSFRSKSEVSNFLSKGPANEFALFDVEGEGCGCGFFPLAALSNHSCLPSSAVQIEGRNMVFYSTKDIEIGEEITQCYGNLSGDGRMNRMENLKKSWGFTCQCLRCRAETVGVEGIREEEKLALLSFDSEHVCACGGVMAPLSRRGTREGNCQCNSFNLTLDNPR